MSAPVNWKCPHCDHGQTVVPAKQFFNWYYLGQKHGSQGNLIFGVQSYECAKPKCGKITLWCAVRTGHYNHQGVVVPDDNEIPFLKGRLNPESSAKPQPNFIPEPLRENYIEACRIVDLSPKSSATLARRCLQGMIRDFCGISKNTLWAEIEELDHQITANTAPRDIAPDTVEAINHVRKIGNYGAHMEKDIDAIVEIEPGEAAALIEKIELLFKEWYVARETRQSRLAAIQGIRETKDDAAKNNQAEAASETSEGY